MNERIIPAGSLVQCGLIQSSAFHDSSLVAFGRQFGVELVPSIAQGTPPAGPIIVIGDGADGVPKNGSSTRVFLAPATESTNGEEITAVEICGEIPGKSWLRGQSLNLPQPMHVLPLALGVGGQVMARSKAGPVWVRETVDGAVVDRVALPLPECGRSPKESVFEWLSSETLPLLLPLIQFLREVTGEHRWHSDLKACYMFDDPNLHASSYGFINYQELADQASRHRYHVSFATTPLDGWFVSARAASLFRECKAQLSLLVHGNDHVHQELARSYSKDQREALLRQALRRIHRLEIKAGVEVCRVMAAPHGACRAEMLGDMARFGFEAACISHGSLRYHNRGCAWTRGLGSQSATIVEGLPVFPRFPMTAASARQKAVLAAYMGQPIVPMGHHHDVSSGLDLLNGLADSINHLGPVRWVSMSEIARTHFQSRTEGQTLVVRPCSRLVRIAIPEGITQLRVEPPASNGSGLVHYSVVRPNEASSEPKLIGGVKVVSGETVWLKSVASDCLDADHGTVPGFRVWPLARRLAGEARDRVKPWLGVSQR